MLLNEKHLLKPPQPQASEYDLANNELEDSLTSLQALLSDLGRRLDPILNEDIKDKKVLAQGDSCSAIARAPARVVSSMKSHADRVHEMSSDVGALLERLCL